MVPSMVALAAPFRRCVSATAWSRRWYIRSGNPFFSRAKRAASQLASAASLTNMSPTESRGSSVCVKSLIRSV
jgi:hypothetical protein